MPKLNENSWKNIEDILNSSKKSLENIENNIKLLQYEEYKNNPPQKISYKIPRTDEEWEIAQKNWEKWYSQFSPVYLSMNEFYQILGKDIRKGYQNYMLSAKYE